jgi:RND family efflux transporter MFP subunit
VNRVARRSILAAATVALAAIAWLVAARTTGPEGETPGREPKGAGPTPVQVAPIERGAIERRHLFTGTLEPAASFVVTSKVAGRVEKVSVELGDRVTRGQVVVRLDDDELAQDAAQARASLAVAKAESTAAASALTISKGAYERTEQLLKEGIATGIDLDNARAEFLKAEAEAEVSQSEVKRASAALNAAHLRAGYTSVKAEWAGDDESRVVAERFVDEGQNVAANAQLLTVVDLDPVKVVIHATEKEYAELQPGKAVSIATDAFPGVSFEALHARRARFRAPRPPDRPEVHSARAPRGRSGR